MISVFLVRDGDGFEGRIIELHLYRKDLNQNEEILVSTYEIDTAQLTSGHALSKQKSSTILLSPLDIDDNQVDVVIGQPDVLVTVGCAFVREVREDEAKQNLHPLVVSDVQPVKHDDETVPVDQYRALTMLYNEAGREHVGELDEDFDDISGFLGEVDELIRGGDSVWSQRHSPKIEAMRRLSSADSETDEVLAAIQEEERVLKELNLGLQQLHSISNFDKHHMDTGKTRFEFEALRKFFACVVKVDPRARSILSGVHTEVMNVGILGEVVGASFSMDAGCVSALSWTHTARECSESEDELDEDSDEAGSDNGDNVARHVFLDPPPIEVSTVDIASSLSSLHQLKKLVINARCLSGDVCSLLELGLEDLQATFSSVSGALDQPALHSSINRLQVF